MLQVPAMTQAVCRWPVTAEARVPSQAGQCEICSEYSGTVTGVLTNPANTLTSVRSLSFRYSDQVILPSWYP